MKDDPAVIAPPKDPKADSDALAFEGAERSLSTADRSARGEMAPEQSDQLTIAFFGHDTLESTIIKRVSALQANKARIFGFMFKRRRAGVERTLSWDNTDLGMTSDMNYGKRVFKIFSGILTSMKHRRKLKQCDVFYARNIDMLLIAYLTHRLSASKAPLVYEVLDIQHLFIGERLVNKFMRAAERWLLSGCDLLVVSSPDHMTHYFASAQKYDGKWFLMENKISPSQISLESTKLTPNRPAAPPWVIGWFGVLKGVRSLHLLTELAEALTTQVQIYVRGIPGGHDIDEQELERICATHDNMSYEGPYAAPVDLPDIYGRVHFTWGLDFLDAGSNSKWCLANRIYEGGAFGSVILAEHGTATARKIQENRLGFVLKEPLADSLISFFKGLEMANYKSAREQVEQTKRSAFIDLEDTKRLVAKMLDLTRNDRVGQDENKMNSRLSGAPGSDAEWEVHPFVSIIMPALNEEKYIEQAIASILPKEGAIDYELLVMDGGSTDRTREIVERLGAENPKIRLLANPGRIQSAAMNLAAEKTDPRGKYMVRADCHACYPQGFVESSVRRMIATKAASVVVPLISEGQGCLQRAIAAAQASKMGNGGSHHRLKGQHGYTDHGHHAAFNRAAYLEIGGYDESFTHNEDAEYDQRLTGSGRKIYLDGDLVVRYFPRPSFLALAKQYWKYGWGRASNSLKHGSPQKARQLLPVLVFLACLLSLFLSFFTPLSLLVPLFYLGSTFLWGGVLALSQGHLCLLLSGPAAVAMHMSWAAGFILRYLKELWSRKFT